MSDNKDNSNKPKAPTGLRTAGIILSILCPIGFWWFSIPMIIIGQNKVDDFWASKRSNEGRTAQEEFDSKGK